MARKTTGVTGNRSKKTAVTVPPATVEVAPEVRKPEVRTSGVRTSEVHADDRKNGNAAQVIASVAPVNLEEAIRRRAYELYLQRRATAGIGNGDENQDWLTAEREIRSRYGNLAHHATA